MQDYNSKLATEEKKLKLKELILPMKKVLIAFSGGVDSTFLLYVAKKILGAGNILAVTAQSLTYPPEEIKAAIELADKLGICSILIKTEEFVDENFIANSKERCYYCKKELFSRLSVIARENNIDYVLDGSNADDLHDFRPGSRAKTEFGVRSPLQEVGLTKAEIRQLSSEGGLPTVDKPSMACLASRIPYGTRIDEAMLAMVHEGETFLKSLGFKQNRVRHHKPIARIEVEKEEIPRLMEKNIMDAINKKFEELGYVYVTIDLKGFRSGSLNEETEE
jgi:uncharacterized protein